MKKLLIALALCGVGVAQTPTPQYLVGGKYVAYAFGQYRLLVTTPVAAAGSASITVPTTGTTLPNGPGYQPIAANTPLYIQDGGNSEIVTPSAATCSAGSCSVTATFANVHGGNFWVGSGSFGLQEAINWAQQQGGGHIVVDPLWGAAAASGSGITGGVSAASLIAASAGYYNVVVDDVREDVTHTLHSYAWLPTAVTQISAPAAVTATCASGGAMSSGAYYASAAYVDAMGNISLASGSNVQTGTCTGLAVPSPAKATGAVGWLPYVTAAAGSDATEILAAQTVSSTNCTLTTLEGVTPACAIGSNATVLANPSATSKEMAESNAFSTWGYTPTTEALLPVPNVYPFGTFVVGGTINSSNEDVAQFQIPAGYLNYLGRGFEVCVKGATATQVASSTLTIALTVSKNYGQSPVTLASFALPTQTQTTAGTQNGCVDVVTTTTGTSGKFFAESPAPWANAKNSAPTTVVQAIDASTAQSSAIDLTKELYFSVNVAEGAGDNITAPIVNQLFIRPIR